jgi:hypothetical protein
MIAAAPVVTYNPTSGLGFGVAGNVAFYRGAPDTTRISSIVASVTGTSKKQFLINAKFGDWSRDNRWHTAGDNRLYWTSQKTYGLGSDTLESAAVDQKYDAFRFYDAIYRRVGRDTYVGAGLVYNIHRDVQPTDDEAATLARLAIHRLFGKVWVRLGIADVCRLPHTRTLRQPRQPDQSQPGLVRERRISDVLRGLLGRHVGLAAVHLRREGVRAPLP